QRLAATEHPRAQPDPQFPTGDARRTEAPIPEAHLRLPLPQHAHPPVPAHRPGRAPEPTRRPQRDPPHREPCDRDPLWADRSPSGGVTYSPIGANCQGDFPPSRHGGAALTPRPWGTLGSGTRSAEVSHGADHCVSVAGTRGPPDAVGWAPWRSWPAPLREVGALPRAVARRGSGS